MFEKGHKHTKNWYMSMANPEHKKIQRKNALRLGLKPPAQYGNKVNLGRVISEETKKKMSEAHKGKKPYQMTDEIRKNMSKALKGRKGKKGKDNHFWKGGITPESKRIRMSVQYRLWRESVFSRDNWICQKCGKKGGILNAHHIKSFSKYPELRFAIDNGITFCYKCHKEIYG
jgi:hypothetical protein